VGGTRFFERREVKDLLAYLRLVVNPADSVGFARIVNVPRRGLGKTTVERLLMAAAQRNLPPLALCQDPALLAECCPGAAGKRLAGFGRLITDLTRLARNGDAATVFKQLLAATKYEEWLTQDDPSTAEERRENVAELGNAVHAFVSESDEGRLEDFLESVSLLSDIDSLQESGEMVTLMTMHTAKGLEFPYVFVAGCEEGLLPHANSMMEDDNVEEERRLFYVALTRARRRVFISAASSRRRFGGLEPMLPSRFLRELPDDCVVEKGEREAQPVFRRRTLFESVEKLRPRRRSRPPRRDPDAQADLASGIETFRRSAVKRTAQKGKPGEGHGFEDHDWNQEEVHFTVGLRVRHELLGEGTVEKVEGVGELTRLTISFGDAGTKKILARYARITILDEGEAL
jgi:DNA helicase-2/ATP-dependent DNA helicase PcrA